MNFSYDSIMKIVYNINEIIFEQIENDYTSFYLEFSSDGFCWQIVNGDKCFFSSENNYLEYNSEEEFYKKLKEHLLNEMKLYKNTINNLKF